MFDNGSIWRPPNCTSYLSDDGSTKETEVKKEHKEEKKAPEPKPVKTAKKGLLSDRYGLPRQYIQLCNTT